MTQELLDEISMAQPLDPGARERLHRQIAVAKALLAKGEDEIAARRQLN